MRSICRCVGHTLTATQLWGTESGGAKSRISGAGLWALNLVCGARLEIARDPEAAREKWAPAAACERDAAQPLGPNAVTAVRDSFPQIALKNHFQLVLVVNISDFCTLLPRGRYVKWDLYAADKFNKRICVP